MVAVLSPSPTTSSVLSAYPIHLCAIFNGRPGLFHVPIFPHVLAFLSTNRQTVPSPLKDIGASPTSLTGHLHENRSLGCLVIDFRANPSPTQS